MNEKCNITDVHENQLVFWIFECSRWDGNWIRCRLKATLAALIRIFKGVWIFCDSGRRWLAGKSISWKGTRSRTRRKSQWCDRDKWTKVGPVRLVTLLCFPSGSIAGACSRLFESRPVVLYFGRHSARQRPPRIQWTAANMTTSGLRLTDVCSPPRSSS